MQHTFNMIDLLLYYELTTNNNIKNVLYGSKIVLYYKKKRMYP